MRYRVSYLTPPPEVRNALPGAGWPNTSATTAYLNASTGFGKSDSDFSAAIAWAVTNKLYERVVDLDAPDLEAVFGMCNSIDAYWGDVLPASAKAAYLKSGGLRSMSVGDLVDDGAGNYWAVASFGFIPVSLPN